MTKRRFVYQPISARNLRKHRTRKRVLRLVVGLLSFSAILFSAVYMSNSPVLAVNDVLAEGMADEQSEVISLARELASTKLLGIFSRKNFLLYPRREIASKITERFSSADHVSVSIVGFEKVLIRMEKKIPLARICHGETCLAMNSSGHVFSDTRFADTSLFLINAPFSVREGVRVPAVMLEAVLFFRQALAERLFHPVRVDLSEYGDIAFYDEAGTRISFDTNVDFAKSLANLDAVIGDMRRHDGQANVFADLKYIDLRFGNKVFVKKR